MRAKTMTLQGDKEYAKVPERLRLFREDCPNGLIETTPIIRDDGQIMFKARIVKDKSKPESAESTGHSLGKNAGVKSFEKLETIAIGRALAILGYLASGEIASSEEMEQFLEYREQQVEEAIAILNNSETLDDLKAAFMSLGTLMAEEKIIKAKDKKKGELSETTTTQA